MTNTVRDDPPFGSVEQRVQRFRRVGGDERSLFARAFGSLDAILDDERWTDGEKVEKIRNLVTALDLVRAERDAKPAATGPTTPAGVGPLNSNGFDYSRVVDAVAPVSPARGGPPRTGGSVSGIADDGHRDSEPSAPVDESPVQLLCVFETGAGTLWRRCNDPIRWDADLAVWRHVDGAWRGHNAMPADPTPPESLTHVPGCSCTPGSIVVRCQ